MPARHVTPLHVNGRCGEFMISTRGGALQRLANDMDARSCGTNEAGIPLEDREVQRMWSMDMDHGYFVCTGCFVHGNGFAPNIHTQACSSCFTPVDDNGECECQREARFDEEERQREMDEDRDRDEWYPEDDAPSMDWSQITNTTPRSRRAIFTNITPDGIEGGHANEPEARETTDDDLETPMGSLLMRSLPDRPMRMVSFEQEIGKGGNYIAEMLYNAGLTRSDYMMSYHSSREFSDAEHPFVTVEEDNSVAAELVWSRMELDTSDHARKLETGLEIVRTAMREKRVGLDMRCGGHIHVDVPDYAPPDAASMHVLWSYVEDTVFRLSAANWRCHRTEIQQGNYAPPVPKGGTSVLQNISNAENAGRAALNYQHLFTAWQHCRCGALRFGLWSECQCRRPQCTLEFRVFNTTANPTKLRAYLALCVGLVQYAKDHTCSVDRFPEFEWNRQSDNMLLEPNVERLSFILNELPLEAADRSAIMYCVERSSLLPCARFLNMEGR